MALNCFVNLWTGIKDAAIAGWGLLVSGIMMIVFFHFRDNEYLQRFVARHPINLGWHKDGCSRSMGID